VWKPLAENVFEQQQAIGLLAHLPARVCAPGLAFTKGDALEQRQPVDRLPRTRSRRLPAAITRSQPRERQRYGTDWTSGKAVTG